MAQELTAEENALLIGGLGRVGATVNSGGGWGARLAAKLLPADVHETEVALPLPVAEAEALVRAVLGVPTGPLRVMVAAGAMGLNPAVVTVTLTADGTAAGGANAKEPGAGGANAKEPSAGRANTKEPSAGRANTKEPGAGGSNAKEPGAGGANAKEPGAGGTAGTTVHIRGVAKEGLIKQHAGREAAENVAEGLRRA